jgi:hypothetical protein
MTAGAERASSQPGATASRISAGAVIAGIIVLFPAPARAGQVGAVVSIFTDDRFRGASISDGRPVGTFDLSFDAANGFYGSLSGTAVATRDEGIQALSAIFNVGYARRLGSGLTADFGATHARYTHYSSLSSGSHFTEVYAGLSGKIVGARISVSPDYFGAARWTAHGEIDAHVGLSRNSFVEGEAGLLAPIGHAYEGNVHTRFDARIGIAQRAGPLTFHAAVAGTTGGDSIYGGHGHDRVGVVLGLSAAL